MSTGFTYTWNAALRSYLITRGMNVFFVAAEEGAHATLSADSPRRAQLFVLPVLLRWSCRLCSCFNAIDGGKRHITLCNQYSHRCAIFSDHSAAPAI